jgi:hypothetical protein
MVQTSVNFEPPEEVVAIREELDQALNSLDQTGNRVGDSKFGVYCFYDYDGEPIYVGQTAERLRVRIRRHLTNQRTDAVAMNVLDPFEVAEVEMWPFWDLKSAAVKQALNSAEYTVYLMVLEKSRFDAVLNEAPVPPTLIIDLPPSVRKRIVPSPIFERRSHPDIRVARRATTIAKLAQVISERQVRSGLRNTLLTQARRLEHLAASRLEELSGSG